MVGESFAKHYGSEDFEANADLIEEIYRVTYADKLDGSFRSAERFLERLRSYAKAPGFEFVLWFVDGKPVGLALGYALPTGARWWQGLTTPVDPELIEEDGTRTFALCELMIHPGTQGEGVGRQLHDELLFNRPERRATLLVDQQNERAQRVYDKWGWKKVGKLRPGWPDAPTFYALILEPLTAPGPAR